uniref:Uncharacterized protein n=1 Tax=Oryza brachyantha TaxID=4533 RepID=J3MXA8_ORYBR
MTPVAYSIVVNGYLGGAGGDRVASRGAAAEGGVGDPVVLLADANEDPPRHGGAGRKLFVYFYASEPRLCLTDTDLIKEFLSSKYAHATGKSWLQRQGTKHFIGGGLLMANGARWSHQRHVVAPAFMADKLKATCRTPLPLPRHWHPLPPRLLTRRLPVQGRVGHMVECTKQTIRALRDAAARGRREVEIGAHMTRLTGDIISRTEFNTSYDTGKRIFHLLEDLQRLTARSSRHLWIPGSR